MEMEIKTTKQISSFGGTNYDFDKKWLAVDDIIKYLEGQKKMCDSDNMDEGKLLALDCEINTLLKELKTGR